MNHQDWKPIILKKQTNTGISRKKNKIYKIPKKLQKELIQGRTNLKMSQECLARKMCVNKDIIKYWECNSKLLVGKDRPNPIFLKKLSDHLKIKLTKLEEVYDDDDNT